MRDTGGTGRGWPRGVQCGWKTSEESSSQGELLLHAPQGLSALHQLLLLIRLQCHVNDICQAAVAQDTGDTQEDLILHPVHALTDDRKKETEWAGRPTRDSGAGSTGWLASSSISSSCSQFAHLDQCGHRVHFVQVLCDALDQVSHRHADGPGGVALQLDDIIGSAVHTSNMKRVRTDSLLDWSQSQTASSLWHLVLCFSFPSNIPHPSCHAENLAVDHHEATRKKLGC